MYFNKKYEEIKKKLESPAEVLPKSEYVIYKDENGDAIEFKVYKNDDYLGNFLEDEMEGRFGNSWSNHVIGNVSLGDVHPLDHKVQDVNVVNESDEADKTVLKEEGEEANYKVILRTDDEGKVVAHAPVNDTQNKMTVKIESFGDDYDAAHEFYERNKG